MIEAVTAAKARKTADTKIIRNGIAELAELEEEMAVEVKRLTGDTNAVEMGVGGAESVQNLSGHGDMSQQLPEDDDEVLPKQESEG